LAFAAASEFESSVEAVEQARLEALEAVSHWHLMELRAKSLVEESKKERAEAASAVKVAAVAVKDAAVATVKEAAGAVKDAGKSVLGAIKDAGKAVAGAAGKVADKIEAAADKVADKAKAAGAAIAKVAKKAWTVVNAAAKAAFDVVKKGAMFVGAFALAVFETFKKGLLLIAGATIAVVDAAISAVAAGAKFAKSMLLDAKFRAAFVKGIYEKVLSVGEAAAEAAKQFGKTIADATKPLTDAVGKAFDFVHNKLCDYCPAILDKIDDIVNKENCHTMGTWTCAAVLVSLAGPIGLVATPVCSWAIGKFCNAVGDFVNKNTAELSSEKVCTFAMDCKY